MNQPVESFKIRLKKAMDLQNLKPVELAEKCGISKSTVSHYMSGYTEPKSNRLYIMAKVLNVNEAWLMGYDVPMERNNYEDQTLMNRDAIIEDIDNILKKDGYVLVYETTDDDFFIIKKSYGQTVAGFYDYELLPRYEALRKKGTVTADLLIAFEATFFRYLESLGCFIGRNTLYCKPYLEYNNSTIMVDDDILNKLKARIDTYSKTTIDSIVLKLKEEDIRKKRVKKEQFAQSLLAAAHERTDIDVTEEMRKHDDDIMMDDSEWE